MVVVVVITLLLLSLPGPGGRVEVGAERELQDVVYGDVAGRGRLRRQAAQQGSQGSYPGNERQLLLGQVTVFNVHIQSKLL